MDREDRDRVTRDIDVRNPVKTASGLNVLAGLWLIMAPGILNYLEPMAGTNDLWTGIAVGVLALIRFLYPERTMWIGWVNAALGVWLIAAPFVLGYTDTTAIWNDVILGAIVTGLSLWSMGAGTMPRPRISV